MSPRTTISNAETPLIHNVSGGLPISSRSPRTGFRAEPDCLAIQSHNSRRCPASFHRDCSCRRDRANRSRREDSVTYATGNIPSCCLCFSLYYTKSKCRKKEDICQVYRFSSQQATQTSISYVSDISVCFFPLSCSNVNMLRLVKCAKTALRDPLLLRTSIVTTWRFHYRGGIIFTLKWR